MIACPCGEELRDLARALGVAIDVSTTPYPPGAYTRAPMRCPHGQTWHCQPTVEQVLTWSTTGTR